MFRALALAGKKCLFLDSSDRYGGSILNFNFEQFVQFGNIFKHLTCSLVAKPATPDAPSTLPYTGFQTLKPFTSPFPASDAEYRRFSRNFNIDLQPKVLYSKSLSVEELIRSGCSNYLEFQNVTKNYFFSDARFVQIPFSKSEVFSNTFLTFKEKRQLVKVIEACLAGYDKLSQVEVTQAKINSTHIYEKEIELSKEELSRLLAYKDRHIREFLEKEMQVEKRMQDILLYALGNINENQITEKPEVENVTTFQFFSRIQKYLRSIGYYGDSPFLLCNYGSSEYSQAFSRIGSLY